MREQQWDAHLLLQFCRVWSDFEIIRDFWKRIQWSKSNKIWYEIENRSDWTFDVRLLLLKRSLQKFSIQIIDYEWLSDWQNTDPWLRVRNRFFSFASFAVYRSSLNQSEDWEYRLDRGVDFVTPTPRYTNFVSESDPLYSTLAGSNELENWLKNQDWYENTEWDQG